MCIKHRGTKVAIYKDDEKILSKDKEVTYTGVVNTSLQILSKEIVKRLNSQCCSFWSRDTSSRRHLPGRLITESDRNVLMPARMQPSLLSLSSRLHHARAVTVLAGLAASLHPRTCRHTYCSRTHTHTDTQSNLTMTMTMSICVRSYPHYLNVLFSVEG